MAEPVRAALLGTGMYAKDVYPGLFRDNTATVSLAAVWSRTLESAEQYVEKFSPSSRALGGDEGLAAIMADASIRLVVVILPVPVALKVVSMALAAGKSVMQEKPVAATAEAAAGLLREYRSGGPLASGMWMLAENYRYEGVFQEAASHVKELGDIIKLDLVADLPMDGRNKYHASAWRRDIEQCPGGFLMDSAVHFVAALRLLAQAAGGGEAASVSAHAMNLKPDMSYPGGLVGVVRFASGLPASVSLTLESHQVRWSLTVVGTRGSLEVSRGGWTGSRGEYLLSIQTSPPDADASAAAGGVKHGYSGGAASPVVQERHAFSGMQREFKAMVALAAARASPSSQGTPGREDASSPEQGFQDLALFEALMRSAAGPGGAAVDVQQAP